MQGDGLWRTVVELGMPGSPFRRWARRDPGPAAASAHALRCDADWQAWRDRLQALEAVSPPDPYATWAYQKAVAELRHRGARVWLVAVPAAGEAAGPLDGAACFVEGERPFGFGRVRVLRSLDFNVMRMAPVLARPGAEARVAAALAAAGPTLARQSGAALATLFKLDAPRVVPLAAALAAAGLPHRLAAFNRSPRLALPDDLQDYLQGKGRKSRYNLRRSERLLGDATGGRLRFARYEGEALSGPEFAARWHEFEALLAATWRAADPPQPYPEAELLAFHRQALADWQAKGTALFTALEAGDTLLAGQLNVRHGTRLWVVLMAYARAFTAHSPGKILFFRTLEALHANGVRQFELGGEGLHWKSEWANDELQTVTLEWPLGGWQGLVWGVAERLRPLVRAARRLPERLVGAGTRGTP